MSKMHAEKQVVKHVQTRSGQNLTRPMDEEEGQAEQGSQWESWETADWPEGRGEEIQT